MLYQLQLWDRASYVQLKAAVSDEDTRERNGETTSHNNDSELKGGGVVIKIELACIHFIFDSHRWLHRWTCLPQAERRWTAGSEFLSFVDLSGLQCRNVLILVLNFYFNWGLIAGTCRCGPQNSSTKYTLGHLPVLMNILNEHSIWPGWYKQKTYNHPPREPRIELLDRLQLLDLFLAQASRKYWALEGSLEDAQPSGHRWRGRRRSFLHNVCNGNYAFLSWSTFSWGRKDVAHIRSDTLSSHLLSFTRPLLSVIALPIRTEHAVFLSYLMLFYFLFVRADLLAAGTFQGASARPVFFWR